MDNSTPSGTPAEEQARENAEPTHKEKRAQSLLEDPILEMIRQAKQGIAARQRVLRDLVVAGWEPNAMSVSLSRPRVVYSVAAWGSFDSGRPCPCGERMVNEADPVSLYLHLDTDGISVIYAEDPGHGVEIPIARRSGDAEPVIPTPEEASRVYGEEFHRAEHVTRTELVYEEGIEIG